MAIGDQLNERGKPDPRRRVRCAVASRWSSVCPMAGQRRAAHGPRLPIIFWKLPHGSPGGKCAFAPILCTIETGGDGTDPSSMNVAKCDDGFGGQGGSCESTEASARGGNFLLNLAFVADETQCGRFCLVGLRGSPSGPHSAWRAYGRTDSFPYRTSCVTYCFIDVCENDRHQGRRRPVGLGKVRK